MPGRVGSHYRLMRITATLLIGTMILSFGARQAVASNLWDLNISSIKVSKRRFGVNTNPLLKSNPLWIQTAHALSSNLVNGKGKQAAARINPIFRQGRSTKREIALTFDDGPHCAYTNQLLTVLRKNSVRATFFVVGSMVQRNPRLLQAIHESGHEIGNHTFSHVDLTRVTMFDRMTEYLATSRLVKTLTGRTVHLCRPPGGEMNPEVVEAGVRCGLTTVTWTCDPGDFGNISEEQLLTRMKQTLQPGAIFLLHSGSRQTLAMLPEFVQYCKSLGYRFATISEMMRPDRSH